MSLRELFIQWLTASQFVTTLQDFIKGQHTIYEAHLQDMRSQLAEQKALYESKIADLKVINEDYRVGKAALKAEVTRLQAVVMPTTGLGAAYAQRFDGYEPPQREYIEPPYEGSLDWQSELQRMMKQEQEQQAQEEVTK